MKCPECRCENREGVKFCEECWARIPPGKKFCGACGHSLEQLPAPSVDFTAPQSYTPKFLTDKILTTRSAMEGERNLVTVLFADVPGFSYLFENLDCEDEQDDVRIGASTYR